MTMYTGMWGKQWWSTPEFLPVENDWNRLNPTKPQKNLVKNCMMIGLRPHPIFRLVLGPYFCFERIKSKKIIILKQSSMIYSWIKTNRNSLFRRWSIPVSKMVWHLKFGSTVQKLRIFAETRIKKHAINLN